MKAGYPSDSAAFSAILRAAHVYIDGEPKILRDEAVLSLLGVIDIKSGDDLVAAHNKLVSESAARFGQAYAAKFFRSLRAFMTMRSRYAEDGLADAVRRGTTQYVVLAAGLDTSSLRHGDLGQELRIFEVDYPPMQKLKVAELRKVGIKISERLAFVPIDFERQNLTDVLKSSGYRTQQPTFFSWLGCTQYLTKPAVFRTLSEIAASARGSEIVFDYANVPGRMDAAERRNLTLSAAIAAKRGEPWLSEFEPVELAARMTKLGLTVVEDLGPAKLFHRYLAGRSDGLTGMNRMHLIKARVDREPA